MLGHSGRERDDVVLRGALDFVDARDVEPGTRPQRLGIGAGTTPASASASVAASSTSSHVS